jgi:threonine synthase
MTTSAASNVFTLEVDGDFDACQALLKAMFADAEFQRRAALSAVNSVNWARIAAQSVYYRFACALVPPGRDAPTFVVPTGNFGDAFSGYVAAKMGASIKQIVVATNTNDLLTRALATGRYERATHSIATLAPAMDIQVASNFERILFEALDRDGDAVRALYEEFARTGGFDIPPRALAFLRNFLLSASIDDQEILEAMADMMVDAGYVACPHTAVAFRALGKLEGANIYAPVIHLATAHPAKFPETVERATDVRPELPAKCADLFQRSEKFDSLPADAEAVKQYIRDRSRAWT